MDLSGDELYQIRARKILPILVRQAKAEQPIFYFDLAREVEMHHRTLNYPLGLIGDALMGVNEEGKFDVPPIQALVVNQKTAMPGEGFKKFLSSKQLQVLKTGSPREKKYIRQLMLSEIFQYPEWDEVLNYFGLRPVESVFNEAFLNPHTFVKGGGRRSTQKLKRASFKKPKKTEVIS